ncbi:MAG: T9SS C-terminal target domain-containing protein [Candidatus Zixiibacteriota bacterium]|nr:MAG: T9SS C-terminal target domain-containing protein [candidate division Zixibacteria bacterium]
MRSLAGVLCIILAFAAFAAADDPGVKVEVSTDLGGLPAVRCVTPGQPGLPGESAPPEPTYTDQEVLWVDEHATAIAHNVDITGNGVHALTGWYLNDERVSKYAVTGTGTPLWEYPSTASYYISVGSSDDGNVMAAAGAQMPMYVWMAGAGPTPSWEYLLPAGYNSNVSVDVSDNGAYIAVVCKQEGTATGGKLIVFGSSSSTPLWEGDFTAGNQINGVEISEDNQWIAVGCYSNFYVFQMSTQTLFATGPNYSQTMVGIDDDAEYLATGDFNGLIKVYRRVGTSYTQQWSNSLGGWVTSVDISSNASTVLAGNLGFNPYTGLARAFDIDGTVRWSYSQYGDYVASVALSNDGSVGVAGSWGQYGGTYGDVFTAFTMSDGSVIFRLLDDIDEPGSIFEVDLSDDGCYAVCGGKAVHARQFGNGGQSYSIELGTAAPPPVEITMTPVNPPIQIPQGGGSFSFNVGITNLATSPTAFDAWVMVQMPSGAWFGPALGPVTLTLPGSGSVTRVRTLTVPGTAPAGTYNCWGYVGTYPGVISDSAYFPFYKAGTDAASPGTWSCTGELFPGEQGSRTPLLPSALTLNASPNPFNPSTSIRYSLGQAGDVNLAIYDLAGREVVRLVDGYCNAGSHEVTFDGSGLASGVYLYRLEAGTQTTGGKLVLLK